MPALRILLVDHPLPAEGLRRLLLDRFPLVFTAYDKDQAIARAHVLRPEILLVEPDVIEPDEAEFLNTLRASIPTMRCIFISRHRPRLGPSHAHRLGVSGFVLQQQSPEELFEVIRLVAQGGQYVAPGLLDWLSAGDLALSAPSPGSLTERQCEVLCRLAEGHSDKEIAALLNISPKTVEFHKGAIKNELGLRTVAQLSRFAMQTGLIGPAI